MSEEVPIPESSEVLQQKEKELLELLFSGDFVKILERIDESFRLSGREAPATWGYPGSIANNEREFLDRRDLVEKALVVAREIEKLKGKQ